MNFRAFLFVFIGAILGVIFSLSIVGKNKAVFIVGMVFSVGVLLFIILTSLLDTQKRFKFFNKFLIAILIGFVLFSSLAVVDFFTFNNEKYENLENSIVTARIASVKEKNSYYSLILENCNISDNENFNKINLRGNISLVVYYDDEEFDNLNVGDIVVFKGELTAIELCDEDKFASYYYKNDIKYNAFTTSDDFSFAKGNMNFNEKAREKVKNILFSNMSYDTASIAYASVFGDKFLIDSDIYEGFSVSGTAHILCVSGLHVGFFVALLYFVFKLCKTKEKYIFIILSVILIFYCYLCGFAFSVVRASIMSIVLCGCKAFGKRYDNLSALSFAGLIILLLKPFAIYDVGFQLSFASCFGIFLLMPLFQKMFAKIHFSNKFSDVLSLTLSAQIGTYPIILHNFEKLSFLSVCANIIIVPLFSVIFSLLLIFIILNLIFPLGFLFKPIEFGLYSITYITKSFGAISTMTYSAFGSPMACSLAFYLGVIIASKFINLKNKIKVLNVLILAVVVCFAYLYQFIPIKYTQNYLINTSIYNSTIITNSYNEKVLVNVGEGTEDDLANIRKDLKEHKILKLDALILSSYNENMQNVVTSLCNQYKIENLFISNFNSENEEKYLKQNLTNTKVIQSQNNYCSFGAFTFKIYSNLDGIVLSVLGKENQTILLLKNYNKSVANFILQNELKADIIKTNYVSDKYLESLKNFEYVFCQNTNIKQTNIFKNSNLSDKILLNGEFNYAI